MRSGAFVWVLMAWAFAAGCISPVIPIGGTGKSRSQLQKHDMGKLFPTRLTASSTWKGEVRVAKLRVWADTDYRAQNVRWQHGFDEQLDYANHVLTPALGLRLEAEYHAWERHVPGASLSDHLAALVKEDPGDDVVWVVGLTSALSLVTPTFDHLGLALLGERHVIVRGHADLEERKAFDRAFPDVDRDEREAVLEARRQHKVAAVLIHELAHSLGALHETEADQIMNQMYTHHASSLGVRNRELMQLTLEERLKPASARDPRALAQRMLAALEVESPGWVADEHAASVQNLRAQLGGQVSAPAVGIAGAVPAAAADQYGRAEALLAQGDHAGALLALEPLLQAYPAHSQLRMLGCKIELARGGAKDKKAVPMCERAAELSPGVEPAVVLASARIAAGDAGGARTTLAGAEARIAKLAPDQAAGAWLALAAQYRAMSAVTWTEDALAKAGAPADHEIARWVATTRIRYGLPREGAKLAPADDAAALAAVRGVLDLVYANKLAAATRAAAAAEKRWPALPGLLAARCDLDLRRGSLGSARALCARAARGGSSWGTYLLGIIELKGTGAAATAAGIARLRAAIAADPELGQAWRALSKALGRANATAELEQLRRDYQARFGAPL